MDDLLTKKVISIGNIYGTIKRAYEVFNRFCEQALGASTLGLPTGYGRPEEPDGTVRKSLYLVQRMAGVAEKNIGQVTHMIVNGVLGLPVDQGVPDVDRT